MPPSPLSGECHILFHHCLKHVRYTSSFICHNHPDHSHLVIIGICCIQHFGRDCLFLRLRKNLALISSRLSPSPTSIWSRSTSSSPETSWDEVAGAGTRIRCSNGRTMPKITIASIRIMASWLIAVRTHSASYHGLTHLLALS